jgi:2-polyprenyl-3-methyl-5-hydroxy-6-metoxy-1,4-benzoquinol methylase
MSEVDPVTKNVASYRGARPDITSLVSEAEHVLDVGCNEGSVGKTLMEEHGCTCVGIDVNPDALRAASDRIDEVHHVDLNAPAELVEALNGRSFDVIIAGDVLEHTIDPWKIINILYDHLTEPGSILISVPNIGRWELLLSLVRQSWPMRERGVHDETHLRFFMRNDLEDLAPDASTVHLARRNYRLRERARGCLDDWILPLLTKIPWLREYFVFQYIIKVSK